MPELFSYLLKINIAITLFYLGYFFFLKKLTFYSWNRMYLVFALLFSAVFPFFKLPAMFNKPEVLAYSFEEISTNLALIPQVEEKQSIIWLGFTLLYWLGMIFGATKVIAGLVSLYRVHIQSVPDHWNGYSFRNLNEEVAPFSFLGTIYLNKEMHSDPELNTVLKHEEEHRKGLHSFDILLVEIWTVFSWFNPVTYFINKAIKVNIEFIADREVITQGISHQQYQTNLVHFATKSAYIPLANQFSFLSLKSRIIMMNKKQSSKSQLSKYVLLIPVILISLFIFGIGKAYDVTRGVELVMDIVPSVEEGQVSTEMNTVEEMTLLRDSIAIKKRSISVREKAVGNSTQKVLENPLIVIDGVVQEEGLGGKGLNGVNPDRIESMSVLKGESATALYGEKGKDGVILLTLKKEDSPRVKDRVIKVDSSKMITIRGQKSVAGDSGLGVEGQKPVTKVIGHRTTEGAGRDIDLTIGDSINTSFKISAKDPVLYLIDGQPADGAAMLKLDSDRIESIEVIKEAKAIAIYGDKAKAGVIKIKTKK